MKSENSPNADHGHIPEAILGATKVKELLFTLCCFGRDLAQRYITLLMYDNIISQSSDFIFEYSSTNLVTEFMNPLFVFCSNSREL